MVRQSARLEWMKRLHTHAQDARNTKQAHVATVSAAVSMTSSRASFLQARKVYGAFLGCDDERDRDRDRDRVRRTVAGGLTLPDRHTHSIECSHVERSFLAAIPAFITG